MLSLLRGIGEEYREALDPAGQVVRPLELEEARLLVAEARDHGQPFDHAWDPAVTLALRGAEGCELDTLAKALRATAPAWRRAYVGAPATINTAFVRHLLGGGYVPVISPVSRDGSGTMGSALNVNGDDAAAAIAVAIGASELLLVADVEGVMSDGAVIASLTPAARASRVDVSSALRSE